MVVTGKREGPVIPRDQCGAQVKRLRGGCLTSKRDYFERVELVV